MVLEHVWERIKKEYDDQDEFFFLKKRERKKERNLCKHQKFQSGVVHFPLEEEKVHLAAL